MNSVHQKHIKKAVDLAKLALGNCAPNPAVGAVVVKNGRVIAEGYHQGPGQPHAEVMALSQLDDDVARGATLYVSLEPCCVHGRTPPCTELIIKKGIKTLVYSYIDPNPNVAGLGINALTAAGIECIPMESEEINDLYRAYHYWWTHRLPWVQAKIALSEDDKIAGKNGAPLKITNDKVNLITHQFRQQADAIVTSAKTIINDNPSLNVRLNGIHSAKPVCVLDRQLTISPSATIFDTAQEVILFHGENHRNDALAAKASTLIATPETQEGLCLHSVLQHLGELGFHKIWIEAGGKLFKSFIDERLVHEAYIYSSSQRLGRQACAAGFIKKEIVDTASSADVKVIDDNSIYKLYFSD